MKKLLFTVLLICFVWCSTGCTSFRLKTDQYHVSYFTLLEDKEFDSLKVSKKKDGSAYVTVSKYDKEVNVNAIEKTASGIGTIAGEAVQAAVTL